MSNISLTLYSQSSHDRPPNVAFVCTHNSCRSQIAEALGKRFASDVFVSYSAGTFPNDRINTDAIRLIKENYDIDMNQTQFCKTIQDIPTPDFVIFMGCDISCPAISCEHFENWELIDPSGQTDAVFMSVISQIEKKVLQLRSTLLE